MELISKYSIKQVKSIKENIYIDCSYAILGRLLSFVASLSRIQDIRKIYLCNIGNIIIKSKLKNLKNHYLRKINLGLQKGPYISKSSPKFLKRLLRNMYKKSSRDFKNLDKVITWQDHTNKDIYFKKVSDSYGLFTKFKMLISELKYENNTN
jgi:ribosomal protein L13